MTIFNLVKKCLFFALLILTSSCASSTGHSLGKKTFDYSIPPQVKLEGVKTIAVLSSRTDASQTLQAQLMEGLQKLNVNIIDTQQLMGIVQEKKLRLNTEDIGQFGAKTNVDLFLVAEVIGPDTTTFKVIGKDGRVSLAKFTRGRSDTGRVKNIVEIFTGYQRSFTDELFYLFPSDDKNKDEIIALHNQGKYKEVEDRMKQVLMSANPPLSKIGEMSYHINLANLYEIQKRFGDALREIEVAEQLNSGLGVFQQANPELFPKAKNLLQSLIGAERDAKAGSGSLGGYKQGAPNIAVLEFDTKAISDKSAGWLAAAYISTHLAQSNFNVYDRDYFRSLIQTETTLSEKEQGELLRADKLIYGKFLKKTQVQRTPIYKEIDVYQPIYDSSGKQVGSRRVPKTVLDKVLVTYGLEIQGRLTDVKTAFGKFQTVKKER
ncbi:MAG: hypothetical protein HY026_10055 [Deltaproteobacteria bacterium]|nr:hypothetical protein [Deltaproteobacteria bacterium]